MTKKKKIIIIAIAVLLLLIIGIIVFLMVKPDDKKDNDNKTTAEINTNSDASTETTEDSGTEDDKTTEDDKKTTEDDAKTTEENEIVKPGSTESAGNNNQNPTTQSPTTQTPSTQAPTTHTPTTQQPTTQAPTTQAPGPCNHTWVNDYVEHVVERAPAYTTEYHDVCNQCGAILDGGLAADHMDAVNCWSYTNNAGFDVQTGYYVSSYDWVKTQKCSKCGETKDVSGQYIWLNIIDDFEPL